MNINDYMTILQQEIGAAVFATVDENNQPHSRFINVGVANEEGVFFMTNTKTDFYQQLHTNSNLAITGMSRKDDLIKVIRITGPVKKIGKDYLEEILKDNPYVKDVYPDEKDREDVQVFHMYTGEGSYQSLTEHIKESFSF